MRSLAIVAVSCLAAIVPAVAGSPVITDLEIELEDGFYVASARLIDALNPEILEEIDSGLETTIGFRLQIHRQRSGLPNPVIVKRRIRCTVVHDTLARQYTLTRRIDDELQETRVTSDVEEMRSFMTALDRIPMVAVETLLSEHSYYLKARSELGLIWRFYLIPWSHRTAWSEVPIVVGEGAGIVPSP